MGSFLLRRSFFFIFVIWGVLTLTFLLSHVVPGDPARLAAGGSRAKPAQVAEIRHELNLDKPIVVQYLLYLKDIVHGNFGMSLRTKRPVAADLAQYFPATFELTIVAMIIMIVFGIPSGIIAAVKENSLADFLSRSVAIGTVSVPGFWLGLMLQLIFFREVHLLPAIGRISPFISMPHHYTGLYIVDSIISGNTEALGDSLRHLILPAVTLAAGGFAVVTRMTRSCVLDVLGMDYIVTARAKGVGEYVVIFKHVMKNAMIPVVTSLGMMIGVLLGGDVLIEVVFSWPGIGQYAAASVLFLDFQAILGVTFIAALAYSLSNLIVDILYGLLDPRIVYT